ncbi:MAG TPA: thiamine-phosphate kinase [Bryobacteraceae bacterium]|nr:thiamine-phosphate kinase [Bryobacteraceae bacterium]
MNELALVDWLRETAGIGARIVAGIGDDCAIYRPKPGEDLLLKSDQLIEGIHFRSGLPPGLIGERALARPLSDIAAMGGEPRVCLLSLAAPRGQTEAWIKSLFRGFLRLARRTGAALAGGDLARANRIYCDAVVCGAVPRGQSLRRDGARPGDSLCVSGRLGRSWERRIQPRLELGRLLRGRATACIDISDGLALDLHRLASASGVAAEVDRVPLVRGATIERGLYGGEDYELLFTLPEGMVPPQGTTRIGKATRGKPGRIRFRGRAIEPRGYDHWA